MSHVSENALAGFDEVEDLLIEFQEKHQNRKSRLGEIMAYYLVGSPAFRELIDAALLIASPPRPSGDMAAYTQKAIVGEIIFPQTPLLQELISGPFDADKLDYMQRDAFMTGIPGVTDVPRLAAKVRSTIVDADKLPARISQHIDSNTKPCTVFGMAFSGSRGLDELLLARVLLFDKIYRHHKVRALEGMIARLLEALQTLHRGPFYKLPYLFTDELLLEADQIIAAHSEFTDGGEDREQTLAIVGDLCARLRERRLFVRASVFGKHFPGMSNKARAQMVLLLNQASEAKERADLIETLAAEVRQVLRLLDQEKILAGLDDQSLPSYLWIDPPGNPDHAQKIVHAFLIRDDGGITPYQEHSPEVAAWSRAYLSRKDVGFVFCIAELQPYTALAMEGLLAREYLLRLPDSAFDHLKEDGQTLGEMRETLRAAGYYGKVRFELRPEPSRLGKKDVTSACKALRDDMTGYSPPNLLVEESFVPLGGIGEERRREWFDQFGDIQLTSKGMEVLAKADILDQEDWASIIRDGLKTAEVALKTHSPVGPLADECIRAWLAQFERPELIGFALQVLSRVRMIGREAYTKVVRDFLYEHPVFKEGVVVGLGDARDSGRIVANLAQDTGLPALDLGKALEQDRPILFVDDFVGSGGQVTGILADWFEESPEGSAKLGEEPRQRLEAAQLERLKGRRTAFVFAAGWSDGAKKLREECQRRGLQAEVHVGESEKALPSLDDEELSKQNEYNAFRKRCEEVARGVLEKNHPDWGEDKLENRLLGYGNKALLVVFPFNTPTQTLTCLWASGPIGAVHWTALFPRRSKN